MREERRVDKETTTQGERKGNEMRNKRMGARGRRKCGKKT